MFDKLAVRWYIVRDRTIAFIKYSAWPFCGYCRRVALFGDHKQCKNLEYNESLAEMDEYLAHEAEELAAELDASVPDWCEPDEYEEGDDYPERDDDPISDVAIRARIGHYFGDNTEQAREAAELYPGDFI